MVLVDTEDEMVAIFFTTEDIFYATTEIIKPYKTGNRRLQHDRGRR